nr:MAG TPA: hypothetical protein [Bacteriophage sp.]
MYSIGSRIWLILLTSLVGDILMKVFDISLHLFTFEKPLTLRQFAPKLGTFLC